MQTTVIETQAVYSTRCYTIHKWGNINTIYVINTLSIFLFKPNEADTASGTRGPACGTRNTVLTTGGVHQHRVDYGR